MKRFSTLIFLLTILLGSTLGAQTVVRRVIGDDKGKKEGKRIVLKGGDIFNINEVGGMVMPDGGKLVILDVIAPEQRPEAYKKVDLRKDDIVQMVEGKPVKSIKELKDAYDKTPIGKAFRMGIKRGGEMMIVSFDKGDPEKLPKIKRMIVNDDGSGHGGGPEMNTIVALPAAGFSLTEKGKDIIVAEMLENPSESIRKAGIAKGDKLTGINGKNVASMSEFREALMKIPAGTKVELQMVHKGKPVTVNFIRGGGKGKVVENND